MIPTHRWLVLSLFLIVLGLALYGTLGLGVNPNNRAFFGPNDPEFTELLQFESDFGSNTSLLFGISSTESIEDDPELVRAVHWLTDRCWGIDGVSRVDSIATYPYGEFSADEISMSTLAEAFCPSVCSSLSADNILKKHLVNRFISADGSTIAVVASVVLDAENSAAVSTISRQSDQIVAEFQELFPSLQLFVTGAVPMMQAFIDASNSDLGSLVLIAAGLFAVLLWTFLRSGVLTLVLVTIGVSSILITMGIAGWFGHTVNTATATTPLVVFTLVVAGSMHVFLYIAREPCVSNGQVRIAIERAYAANMKPVVLAAVTSVVGLLSLVFVAAPPIKQLGVLSALGVFVGSLVLLFVAPALLSMIQRIKPSTLVIVMQRLLNNQAKRIELGKGPNVLVGSLFLACIAFLPMMNIDEDFVRYFGEGNSFRDNSEEMTHRLAGPYHAEIVIDSGSTGGMYDPEVILLVDKLSNHIREDRAVVNVLSVADVLSEVAYTLSGESSLDELNADALAQYFLSFELSLSKGQSTTDFIDVDHRMVRISILFGDVSMREIRAFQDRVNEWSDSNLPSDLTLVVTGEGIPTAHLSNNSIQQLMVGIGISLAFSSLLLGWIYSNPRIVGVVLLATTLPILAGFGVWSLLVGEIGMAATLVVAVTIGVVIDDSIHLLFRFQDGMSELDLSAHEAAGYSVHRTAAAILTTSIVLSGGFSILMLSEFKMNSAFGVCSALVILMALVYNTTLMPRSLIWAVGRNRK